MEEKENLHIEREKSNIGLPILREEKNLIKQREYPNGHEIVIKFHAQQKGQIVSLLSELFYDIHFAQSEDGKWLWAYCKYNGDINELDQKLYTLRTKGLIGIGQGSENAILELFVDLKNFPIQRALQGPPKVKKNKAVPYILFFIAMFFIFASYSYLSPLIAFFIESKVQPSFSAKSEKSFNASHPSWNKFIFPRYQDKWMEIRENFGFNNQEMVEIFRRIKDIERYRYGSGQMLNDLTVYPEVIERALNILVLRNVKTTGDLDNLVNELKPKFTYSRAFPDEQNEYVNMLDNRQFNNMGILAFYEDVLQKEGRFTQELIAGLQRKSAANARLSKKQD